MDITARLFELQDKEYRDFQMKLIPDKPKDQAIGVRTPELKKLAKELVKEGGAEDFLKELPHRYFDEMQLHAFIITEEKDFRRAMELTEEFLPYVDNWATCDQLRPRAFRKDRPQLMGHIRSWLDSDRTYTVRFGIGMLMSHFLDEDFREEYLASAAKIRSEEYYINMMIAWYFATALAKQYDAAVKYLEEDRLDPWVKRKTIQKARESFRVTEEHKTYLKSLLEK